MTDVPHTTAMTQTTRTHQLSAAQIWAMWGVLLLIAQIYTWVGFFGHGPVSAVPEGEFKPLTYWAARVVEVMNWTVLIFAISYVVRQCRRERRFTFDAQFCVAGALTYWCDPIVEFFQPIFFNTSYYVNVRDWTGFMPFIVNPDAGQILEPYLAYFPIYAGGFLSCAITLNALMHKVKARNPNVTIFSLFALGFVIGAVLEIIMELIWLRFELISYPGAPDFLAVYVGDLKMPFIEWVTAGVVFASFSLVRFYVNDKGERITERGLERFPVPLRRVISTLAMMAILNTLMITVSLADAFVGLYSAPYRAQPAHLLVGACDVPGSDTQTRYGPCPGSPGYRMPLPGSLDGPNPHGRN